MERSSFFLFLLIFVSLCSSSSILSLFFSPVQAGQAYFYYPHLNLPLNQVGHRLTLLADYEAVGTRAHISARI